MEHNFILRQIGTAHTGEEGFYLAIAPQYREALAGLEDFRYINVLWWFSGCDNSMSREKLWECRPYVRGPEVLGAFATRTPERPNPIALSCARVTHLDRERGVVGLDYLDAEEGSPVLDLKPYLPSLDRVERPVMPAWCAHWPDSVEKSGDFDWEKEFNF